MTGYGIHINNQGHALIQAWSSNLYSMSVQKKSKVRKWNNPKLAPGKSKHKSCLKESSTISDHQIFQINFNQIWECGHGVCVQTHTA